LRIDSRIGSKQQAQVCYQVFAENNSEKNLAQQKYNPTNKTFASVRLREIKNSPFKLRCVAKKADTIPDVSSTAPVLN
jgi:hypothetical protein